MRCTAYDIDPKSDKVIKADFLTLDIPYKRGRLCIGNPPFGHSNLMSIRFYKKCCAIGDYIAFIQPISQYQNTLQMYEFDLIYSEDLGTVTYSDRELHCCFNIYVRPKHGLNPVPKCELEDVRIIEKRVGRYPRIPQGWDCAICGWGSLGKIPTRIGEYASEYYIYILNKKHRKEI